MKKQNNNIVERAAAEYKAEGYEVEKDVFLKIEGKEGYYVVPVVATKGKTKVAIEVDGSQIDKIDYLKTKFDKVFVYPTLEKSEDGWFKHFCGHKWKSRVESPKQCPGCKQYLKNDS